MDRRKSLSTRRGVRAELDKLIDEYDSYTAELTGNNEVDSPETNFKIDRIVTLLKALAIIACIILVILTPFVF